MHNKNLALTKRHRFPETSNSILFVELIICCIKGQLQKNAAVSIFERWLVIDRNRGVDANETRKKEL